MDIKKIIIILIVVALFFVNGIVNADDSIETSLKGDDLDISNQQPARIVNQKLGGRIRNPQHTIINKEVSSFVERGVAIDFYVEPLLRRPEAEAARPMVVKAGEEVIINFSITDTFTGNPISGLVPDSFTQHKPVKTKEDTEYSMKRCRSRAFKRGRMFEDHLPLMENVYVMCLNSFDGVISVIDPLLKPKFIAKTISLGEKGVDLALKEYGTDLYVTTESGNVIIIDCMRLEIIDHIKVGSDPHHIAFQPDGYYTWVGNDGDGTVSVIDTEKRSLVTNIEVGKGHHEIAFTDDSLYAYVTNRDDNSLTVIDVINLSPVKTFELGVRPYSPVYSRLSQCVYVANEGSDSVSVFDTLKQKVIGTIAAGKGVRSLKLDDEGRICFALNRQGNSITVIDVSLNSVIKTIPTGIRPESMAISTYYGYVRNVGSPDVTVIKMKDLSHLGEVPIGDVPPNIVDLKEGHLDIEYSYMIIVPNPTDDIVYTIMFGDPETAFKYKTGRKGPSKIELYWIGLKEVSPGIYSRVVKFEEPGRHEVGLYVESPETAACFEVNVLPHQQDTEKVRY